MQRHLVPQLDEISWVAFGKSTLWRHLNQNWWDSAQSSAVQNIELVKLVASKKTPWWLRG